MLPRYEIAVDIWAEYGETIQIHGLGPGPTLVGSCSARRRAVRIAGRQLDWLGPPDRRSTASAVVQGQIYGTVDGRACRFDGERAVELPGLGGEVSGVKGGGGRHVVGWADTDRWDTYEAGTSDEHRSPRRVGVRWEGERAVELGSPEGPNAMTHAVNEHGIVVGSADVGLGGPKRACRWSVAGSAEWLVAAGRSSDATGIDDRGTVIGWVHGDDDRYRPFASSESQTRWLSLPGDSAFPKDINNHGWIVGSVSWKSERHRWPREVRAWLWVDGAEQAVALDTLVEHPGGRRLSLYHALFIDDDGVIVATVGGPSHAVVLRPR